MHLCIETARFKFMADGLGIYLRLGRRAWYWNNTDRELIRD